MNMTENLSETQARLHAALDERLNNAFQELSLGRAGYEKEGGGKVSAYDVVASFRCRTPDAEKGTTADALASFLQVNDVPTERAVEIGILWGARYGAPPEQDFDLNVRPHTAPDFDLKVRPRDPQVSTPQDFPVTIRPRE